MRCCCCCCCVYCTGYGRWVCVAWVGASLALWPLALGTGTVKAGRSDSQWWQEVTWQARQVRRDEAMPIVRACVRAPGGPNTHTHTHTRRHWPGPRAQGCQWHATAHTCWHGLSCRHGHTTIMVRAAAVTDPYQCVGRSDTFRRPQLPTFRDPRPPTATGTCPHPSIYVHSIRNGMSVSWCLSGDSEFPMK